MTSYRNQHSSSHTTPIMLDNIQTSHRMLTRCSADSIDLDDKNRKIEPLSKVLTDFYHDPTIHHMKNREGGITSSLGSKRLITNGKRLVRASRGVLYTTDHSPSFDESVANLMTTEDLNFLIDESKKVSIKPYEWMLDILSKILRKTDYELLNSLGACPDLISRVLGALELYVEFWINDRNEQSVRHTEPASHFGQ